MTKALTWSYRIGQMAWLHAVHLLWSRIRCGIPFTTTKVFEMHLWMLRRKECSIKHRLRYFEAIVSSTICLASIPKTYSSHCGASTGTNWSTQWGIFGSRNSPSLLKLLLAIGSHQVCLDRVSVCFDGWIPFTRRPREETSS